MNAPRGNCASSSVSDAGEVRAGALKLAGPYADKIWEVIQGARQSLSLILKDPLGFAKNLVSAVVGGFKLFGKHNHNLVDTNVLHKLPAPIDIFVGVEIAVHVSFSKDQTVTFFSAGADFDA